MSKRQNNKEKALVMSQGSWVLKAATDGMIIELFHVIKKHSAPIMAVDASLWFWVLYLETYLEPLSDIVFRY